MLETDGGAELLGPAPARRESSRERLRRRLGAARRSQILPLAVLWLLVVAFFGVDEPRYLSQQNLTSVLEQNSVLFVVAMAATIVLLTGAVDLSVGGLLALSGLLLTLGNQGLSPELAVLVTILAGGLLSAVFNGLPVGLGKMNPFVVTLGTGAVFFGVANLLTGGSTELIDDPSAVMAISSSKVGPLPVAVLVMAAVLGAAWWVLRFTYFGRNVYAVGGNPEAATLAGLSVARVRILAFLLLGLAAGLGAVLQAGQLASVAPSSGVGLELEAIAAVLLGGTALAGGRGGVASTAVAVLFLASLRSGLDISGVSSFWQQIVTGTVLVVAVGFGQARKQLALRGRQKGSS